MEGVLRRVPRDLLLISLLVVAVHGLLFAWIGWVNEKPVPSPPAKSQRLTVQAIALQPQERDLGAPQAAPAVAEVRQTPPKIVPKPAKKKTSEKKPTKKPAQKAETPAPNPQREKLLQQARQSLAQLKQPIAVTPGHSAGLSSEGSYADALALRLRQLMQLPDLGNVQVRIAIKKDGTVQSCQILQAESETNRRYVEKTLPTLRLPVLGTFFPGEEVHTFTLTLSND